MWHSFRLKWLIANNNLSQADISRICNVTETTVHRWVKGSHPIIEKYWPLLDETLDQKSIIKGFDAVKTSVVQLRIPTSLKIRLESEAASAGISLCRKLRNIIEAGS